MGQGLSCGDCIYYNQCHSCIGVSMGLFCCSCWLCAPPELQSLRGPDTCRTGCNQGYGSTFFCLGHYCCAPNYLIDYSIWSSIGQRRGQINNITINEIPHNQREMYGVPNSNRAFH